MTGTNYKGIIGCILIMLIGCIFGYVIKTWNEESVFVNGFVCGKYFPETLIENGTHYALQHVSFDEAPQGLTLLAVYTESSLMSGTVMDNAPVIAKSMNAKDCQEFIEKEKVIANVK